MPYSYLFTIIKSPTTSVGIIDPDGILYGSMTNERMNKTNKRIGKIDLEKSETACMLPEKSFIYPMKAKMPVKNVAVTNNTVKSNIILVS